MQRGGSPTAYDRTLATTLGTRAAALVAEGTTGVMVAVQNDAFTQVPLDEIAGKTRTVPLDDPLIASGLDVGTSFGVAVSDLSEAASHSKPASPIQP
jgi:6-phosphofructokinase 1